MRINTLQDALFLEQPDKELITGHGDDRLVSPETFHKGEYIFSQARKCLCRFRRLNHREDAFSLLGHVPVGEGLIQSFVEVFVMAFEVYEELLDGLDEQADPTQMAHVGKDMDRIETLFRDVNGENLGKLRGNIIEDVLVQVPLGQYAPHGPQGLGADISVGIGRAGDVQSVMPLEIIGELIHRFFIG